MACQGQIVPKTMECHYPVKIIPREGSLPRWVAPSVNEQGFVAVGAAVGKDDGFLCRVNALDLGVKHTNVLVPFCANWKGEHLLFGDRPQEEFLERWRVDGRVILLCDHGDRQIGLVLPHANSCTHAGNTVPNDDTGCVVGLACLSMNSFL